MRRTRRWFEALTSIKAGGEPNPFAARNGWRIHEAIQKDFPHARAEKPEVFSDPRLDFDIGYHCDLYDPERRIVYEIKPRQWYEANTAYCEAQLGGYVHFRDARGVFLLYATEGGLISYAGLVPKKLPSWDELRQIASKSDEMLLAQGK